MPEMKVNMKLWSAISEKERKDIASNLDLEITKDSNAPVPRPEDIVYGMTIKEAAMLLAKEDKSEFEERINKDIEIEKKINNYIKERSNAFPQRIDFLSKIERMRKKDVVLSKDEQVKFDKIKSDLKEKISSVTGEVDIDDNYMIYKGTVGELSYRYFFPQASHGLIMNCLLLCEQAKGEFPDCFCKCVGSC